MTIAAQADAITSIVSGVQDVGIVHPFAAGPAKNDWASLVAYMTTTITGYNADKPHIRAWVLQYLGETRTRKTIAIGGTKIERRMRWRLRGWLSLAQDIQSEIAFRDLVESVADALDARPSLGGACITHLPVTIDLGDGSPFLWGEWLVHGVTMDMTTVDEQTYTTS